MAPRNHIGYVLLLLLIAVSTSVIDQERRASPLSITASRYKDTYVKIVYSQPQKKGREIFGNLVPFGEVWRTGANESTEITFTTDIMIAGNELKAGTYSLFTIPNKDYWTIIFNADLGLWGSYNYNPKQDILRIDAAAFPQEAITEAFTIGIDPKNNVADLFIMWDKTKVIVPIQYLEPIPKQ